MVKKLISCLLICTFCLLAGTYNNVKAFADLSTTTCPGAGCVVYTTEGQTQLAIQVTGTFVGTLTFSSTVDGTNFVVTNVLPVASGTAVSTATAPGMWTLVLQGHKQVRVAFTAFTSGTAVVTVRTLSK